MNIGSEIEIQEWKPELPVLLTNPEKEVAICNENFVEANNDTTEIQHIQTQNGENCQQKCHICDQFFQNLESHFASSHMKEENSDENTINDNPSSKDFESENFVFELLNISKIKAEIKEEHKIKEEIHEDNIPLESDANGKILNEENQIYENDQNNPKDSQQSLNSNGPIINPVNSISNNIQIVEKSTVKKNESSNCGKSFSLAGNLKQHVKAVHEGLKDHVCNHCGKSFSRAEHLKRHVKAVHEGVKDHVCNHCETSFSRADKLKRHVKAVHEGVKHACNHCEMSFSRADSLKTHVKAIHEGVKDHV